MEILLSKKVSFAKRGMEISLVGLVLFFLDSAAFPDSSWLILNHPNSLRTSSSLRLLFSLESSYFSLGSGMTSKRLSRFHVLTGSGFCQDFFWK
jgi:hypothetical protein